MEGFRKMSDCGLGEVGIGGCGNFVFCFFTVVVVIVVAAVGVVHVPVE